MVEVMGWMNLVLVVVMGIIYPVKKYATAMLQKVGKEKSKGSMKLYQLIRQIHPILGTIIVLLGLLHGYLAIGTMRLHTGLLIVIMIMLMGIVAIFGPKLKVLRKKWRTLHRSMGLFLFIFVIIHLFWRNLI